jgi:site-specific recombinase XerD
VPTTIIPTFSDEQLQALLAVPDKRTWLGIRDRAILLLLLDTLIRVSELVGLDAEDVDLDEGMIRVMGKGWKERRVPFGMAASQALTIFLIRTSFPRGCAAQRNLALNESVWRARTAQSAVRRFPRHAYLDLPRPKKFGDSRRRQHLYSPEGGAAGAMDCFTHQQAGWPLDGSHRSQVR